MKILTIKFSILVSMCVCLAWLFVSNVRAQQPGDIGQTVDRYLSIRSEMGAFSGAVLIVKQGRVLLRRGYGFADVDKRVPFNPETRHEVASVSKMFTSAAAIRLRDTGKLRLDDHICKYLDSCPDVWQPITVKQLMNHTSGIPDYEEALDLGSDKYLAFMTRLEATGEIVENARKLPLDFKPGEKFKYSNTGYILLSYIIQKAAGMPFARYVETEILKPARMDHSGVIDSGRLPDHLAAGYTHDDLGWEKTLAGVSFTDGHMRRLPQLALTSPEGDAWLYSTLDDLYRWSEVMDGKSPKLLSASDIEEILSPNSDGYGYGWFIGKGFDRRRFRHNGALPGYLTDFIKFPDDNITIVFFCNNERARLSAIARDVSAIVLGTPYDMPIRRKVIKISAEQTSALVGEYKMADGKILTVTNEPDFLTAKLQDRFTAGLIPLSPTEFYFPLADGRAIFTLGPGGKAAKVNLRYSGEDHVATRTAN